MLAGVEVLSVPPDVIEETEASLRVAGRDGHELFVLWTGRIDGTTFEVHDAHVPRQVSYRSEHGCGVRVDGEELHRLNTWLFEHGQLLGAQIHSHPEGAFHSETDDTFPIVTAEGGVSIVAAFFGRDGLFALSTATFRLTRDGWMPAPRILRIASS